MAHCTFTVPDKNASGDNLYGPLVTDAQRNYFWKVYAFRDNGEYWDEGWGREDPANTDLALARTYNACWALSYSAVDPTNDGYGGSILNWARRYVRDQLDDLRAQCGSNPYQIAQTLTGFTVDDRTELYGRFFFGISVVERAAVLVHESRHYEVEHNAQFPPWSALANKGQGEQADSSWAYNGAYHFEVAWLASYVAFAVLASPAQRELARQRANWCLDNAFAAHPGFTIAAASAPQPGWRWCGKCHLLAFAGFGEIGPCAAGGIHDHTGSWNYTLIHGKYGSGWNGWMYCTKCHALAFVGLGPAKCVAGGLHEHSGSWNFAVSAGTNHPGTQRHWTLCGKCHGLASGAGACPAGGQHTPAPLALPGLNADFALPVQRDDVYPANQPGWRWCGKCQGLAYAPNGAGHCPAGGGHDYTGSWNLVLFQDAPALGQANWRWCSKCQGLAFGGSAGVCPAGGGHDHTDSGDYVLQHDGPNIGQTNWRWCSKCQGLNWAGNNAGCCPAGGGHNQASFDYGLSFFPG